jgi:hypothetical protein
LNLVLRLQAQAELLQVPGAFLQKAQASLDHLADALQGLLGRRAGRFGKLQAALQHLLQASAKAFQLQVRLLIWQTSGALKGLLQLLPGAFQ